MIDNITKRQLMDMLRDYPDDRNINLSSLLDIKKDTKDESDNINYGIGRIIPGTGISCISCIYMVDKLQHFRKELEICYGQLNQLIYAMNGTSPKKDD